MGSPVFIGDGRGLVSLLLITGNGSEESLASLLTTGAWRGQVLNLYFSPYPTLRAIQKDLSWKILASDHLPSVLSKKKSKCECYVLKKGYWQCWSQLETSKKIKNFHGLYQT